ncbi:alpha/beta fold hydrolase [Marinoscillum furvescens]|uniref:Pimeloyl-ACP methyl ester carboxylesterase n=1 Tax=Marinoscillum furvescens DSM 4134 TaxID=1122208 RepID=A0A3D9KZ43_MARFU|nr:alpha/beta hydrolase [Marinoscillum furvescens]RED94947.1 pimeloyl-ACP methyl ester carboxylesterase [Marinoscillum furvescens DSM 4134]
MNTYNLILALFCCLIGVVASAQQTVADVIAPYAYKTNYLNLNDSTRLAYIDEGKGERTLIMIHGLATYLPSFYPVFDDLKKENRCIAVDLPGYGRSSKREYPATMSYYAAVIEQLIEKLEVTNPVLVGHSMGAQVAVTAVLENPKRYRELILLAPAGFETFTTEQAAWLKAITRLDVICDATDEQIRSNWALNFYRMPQQVAFMITDRIAMRTATDFRSYGQAIVSSVSGMLDQPVYDRLGELPTRTLVVYGADDALIPNKYLNPALTTAAVAEAGTEKIADVRLEMIPQCGHFITYDQPEAINKILNSFLKE